MALIALLATVSAGCLLVLAILRVENWEPRWAAWLLAASLGAGLGMALNSCLYLLLLRLPVLNRAFPFLVLIACLALWLCRRRRPAPGAPIPHDRPAFRWNWVLGLAFAACLLLVFGAILDSVEANPHGQWDAWSIWNLRAKFLAGPGETWKRAVSPLLAETHPDYPLLQSAFIALLWRASGATTTFAPIATALVFFASALGLLVSALALLRGTSAALLAGLVALANTSYLLQPAGQYADVPLSLYYLAVLVLVFLANASGRPALLVTAGLFASCAAWTKNEGIAFTACVLASYFVVAWRSQGLKAGVFRWAHLLLGSLPGLLLTAYFKLVLAPVADPLLRQNIWQVLPRFADPARYAAIAKALATEALELGLPLTHPLLLLAILVVALRFRILPAQRARVVFGAFTLVLVWAAYCCAYLASPSLSWQLSTSLGRLYAQLWPACLLVLFMMLGRIEDRTSGAG